MRWLWALAATACAPLLLRGAALAMLATEGGGLAAFDLQGLLSDLGVAGLAAALLVGLLRWHAGLGVAFAALWSAGHYANYEHVVTLGAPASLRDLHYLVDPTFFAGSALGISRPGWLAGVVVLAAGLAWCGRRAGGRAALGLGAAGALLCAATAAWPDAPAPPVWRQVDFLQRDAAHWWASRGDRPAQAADAPAPPEAMLARWPELAGDLSGSPRIPDAPRARNVLLVVLESVSGLHLPSVAREQGREADVSMPALDAFSRQSLRFVSFVAHQRKTNRGLYALLCGELPNLGEGTPKMSAAAVAPWRVCLPRVLREAGWHTAYLQAAPLSFMLKDRFMAQAGFEEIDGYDGDEPSYSDSAWGVDDRAFFEQALGRVDALRESDQPWFLTLLNVGTHHPFAVPDDYRPGPRSFRRAASYLDEAFGAFAAELDARGVWEDTLVVVTSDESIGILGFDTEPIFKRISQNWGVLLLRGPGVAAGVERAPFGLADLALSLVDYLGLAERGEHFFGRSVFRRYEAPRHLFFGNGNLGSLGAFEPGGTLLSCSDGGRCQRYPVPDGRWFGVLPPPTDPPPDDPDVALLHDLAALSAPQAGHRPDRYALLPDAEVVLDDGRPRMLHGGQFVRLLPGEWIEVEYEVSVEGTPDVRVDWVHALTGHRNEGLFRRRATLHAGQHLRIAYRYAPEDPSASKDQIQCRTTVRLLAGERAVLRHGEATLRIRRDDPPAPGATLLRYDVDAG